MIITRTPYRISFFGGGTDYPSWFLKNGGAVISATIDKYIYMSSRFLPPFFERRHRIVWSKVENVDKFQEIEHPVIREGLKYLKFNQAKGLDIHYQADLPARSGMGSSSAFTVGLIHCLRKLNKNKFSKMDLALDAIHLEQNLLREIVGCQDQIACAFGGLNKITFHKNKKFLVEPLLLPPGRIEELESNLYLIYLGIDRFASQVAQKFVENFKDRKKNLNKIFSFVFDAVKILESKKNLDEFGELLHETWMQKKAVHPIISNERVEVLYNTAIKNGAIGGKLLGAGKSGFMLFYVNKSNKNKFLNGIKNYLYVPFKFSFNGTNVIQKGY